MEANYVKVDAYALLKRHGATKVANYQNVSCCGILIVVVHEWTILVFNRQTLVIKGGTSFGFQV